MLTDASLVLPGRARLNAISLIVNECDLIFIPDNDLIATTAFIFRKHSRAGAAVSRAMMSMVEYMIAIGERYSTHESDGDKCRKIQDEQKTRLQTHVLQVHVHCSRSYIQHICVSARKLLWCNTNYSHRNIHCINCIHR